MSDPVDSFCSILSKALPNPSPLHAPLISSDDINSVAACLHSGFVSSVGSSTSEFETRFSDYVNSEYSFATNSGTSALHLALLALGIDKDTEIFLPSLTFIATANAISYVGCVPHFLDIDQSRLGISPSHLRKHIQTQCVFKNKKLYNLLTGRQITAMIAVHLYGIPCDIFALRQICQEYNLFLIEDSAESLGSYVNSIHTGTIGDVGIFSFNGNKIISTGGGGMLVTNNSSIYERVAHLGSTARIKNSSNLEHDEIGYNYRMPSLNASLGLSQLSKINSLVTAKRNIHQFYSHLFSDYSFCSLIDEPADSFSNYWLNSVLLSDLLADNLLCLVDKLQKIGIQTRPAWKLLPLSLPYLDCPRALLHNSQFIFSRLLTLPSSPNLCPRN